MERMCKRLNKKYPCRAGTIKQLVELLGNPDKTLPPAIFIHGDASTGKSCLVRGVLRQVMKKHLNVSVSFVNAIESYTTKVLLENMLIELLEEAPACNNLHDFINTLALMGTMELSYAYILIVDNAERLRDMEANVLATLLRLPELTGLNICCVLMSQLPLEKFYTKTGLSEVISLHCAQYTKNEVQEILSLDFKQVLKQLQLQWQQEQLPDLAAREKVLQNISADFYNNYLMVFLSVFYKACRDLKELRMISGKYFAIYMEPVLDGSISASDVSRLWRHIAEPLRRALAEVYMRFDQDSAQITTGQNVQQLALSLELPYYAKYLLIAGYLASHNSAKDDKRLFVKHHGKQRKRMQTVNAKSVELERKSIYMGPKSFCIDRLLAIFYAILEEKVGLTCNLLSQISTLVQLKLLAYVSGEDNVMGGGARLQCTVGMELIQHIGKTVDFNVRSYLCDLM